MEVPAPPLVRFAIASFAESVITAAGSGFHRRGAWRTARSNRQGRETAVRRNAATAGNIGVSGVVVELLFVAVCCRLQALDQVHTVKVGGSRSPMPTRSAVVNDCLFMRLVRRFDH